MPRNGSGVYSAPSNSWNPAIDGTDVDTTDWAALLADMSTALTGSIASNGVTTITANLPMSGFKHTGVGNASARTQYPSVGQLQDQANVYAATSGASAYTLTLVPAVTAWVAGMRFTAKIGTTNPITTPTISPNGITAKTIVNNDGTALLASQLAAGGIYDFTYDGTNVQVSAANLGPLKAPQYLTLAASSALTNERVLTFSSTSFSTTDGGAGSAYTVKVKAGGINFFQLDTDFIADASSATVASADLVLFGDSGSSNLTKRTTAGAIAALAGAGWVLLEKATPLTVSSWTTTVSWSGYTEIEVDFYAFPGTDSQVLKITPNKSGPTAITACRWDVVDSYNNSGSFASTQASGTASVPQASAINNRNTANSGGIRGSVRFFDVASGSYKGGWIRGSFYDGTRVPSSNCSFLIEDTNPIISAKFAFASGNLSGTFVVRGR